MNYVAAPRAGAGHLSYRRDIDGLRAIAVLGVLAFHAFPAWLQGGFVGVDVFFVISGYLISAILLGAIEAGNFSFTDFYARRARRIFPALVLVLGATFAIGWMALLPDELKQLGKHMLGGAGFTSNLVLWNEVGYFDTAAETKPLLHLWSLGIEEQFYIFWPAILLFAHWRRLRLLTVMLVLGAASFALNVAGLEDYPSATFYSPASRGWELLAGAALAWAGMRQPQWLPAGGRTQNAVSVAGLALVLGGMIGIAKGAHFPGWLALLPVGGAVLLIGAGPDAWINRHLLGNRVLVWIGLISYPLYLWHWPLLSYAQIIEAKTPAPELRAQLVLLSFVLAALTYWLVERPLRGGGARRTKVALLWALLLAVAGVGAYTWHKDGFPQRASQLQNAQNHKELILVEDVANAAACKARYGFASFYEYCLQADPAREPTVALIGDSHAYHVNAGLMKYYSSIGENFVMFGTRVPYFGIEAGKDEYQQATGKMLDLALNTPTIHTVIISTATWLAPGTQFSAAATDTIRRYVAAGKQVIYMNDVPRLDFEPRACIPRVGLANSSTRSPCAVPRKEIEAQMSAHNAHLESIVARFPGVQLFNPARYLCDAEYCWAMKDGRLLYRDDDHLSYGGDLYLGEKFAEEQRARRAQAQGKRLQ